MIDYHVHTLFSGDSSALIEEQLAAASKHGIEEICFTDHIDFDNPGNNFEPADLFSRHEALKKYGGHYKNTIIREGAEISMAPSDDCSEKTRAYLAPHELDFIIGSVHCVDGVDVYYPEYHRGKSREEAYNAYLQTIFASLPKFPFISVLGHYDFVAKYAPYEDRTMTPTISNTIRDSMEQVFRLVVSMGKGIEINTAAWRDGAHWGLDVLKLYRECGGEFVTFASDAHRESAVAGRLDEAFELALAAGIPYYAVFEKMRPTFRKLEK